MLVDKRRHQMRHEMCSTEVITVTTWGGTKCVSCGEILFPLLASFQTRPPKRGFLWKPRTICDCAGVWSHEVNMLFYCILGQDLGKSELELLLPPHCRHCWSPVSSRASPSDNIILLKCVDCQLNLNDLRTTAPTCWSCDFLSSNKHHNTAS